MSEDRDDPARIDWLRLARAEAVGPVTFAHLIGRYGSATRALAALPDLARRGGRSLPPRVPGPVEARAELDAGEALGARLILGDEPDFPRLLAVLDPPPTLVWVLGDSTLLARRTVAVVGARTASAAGQRFARALAGALGEAGYIVVSGMARGIDAAAHRGALETGTVAVIAGGVDTIYPLENAELYGAIRAKGCLITARLAGEQGREVFAVPGSPLDPRARGANDLLRQGATLVEEADDVLRVLDTQPGMAAPEPATYACRETPGDVETDELRAVLAQLLSPTPISIDELARAAGAPTPSILAALMELSLAGRAELLPGVLAASA